jgi:hypothetical protein
VRLSTAAVAVITAAAALMFMQDKPMVVEPALMKLKQFLAQIDEDPTIDLDGPIKRLRQVRLTSRQRQDDTCVLTTIIAVELRHRRYQLPSIHLNQLLPEACRLRLAAVDVCQI